MKLLVTGRTGQVAMSVAERAEAEDWLTVTRLGRPEFDLADPASIERAIDFAEADLVLSAAAYTAVDRAEDEPALAMAVNATGAGAVATAAAKKGLPVLHLSTDYVFPGTGMTAHVEDDPTGPLGVYGQSKLEGERRVAEANPRHLILRTAWVYSPFGNNFVRTMLRLAAEREAVSVVADQWGNPTSALDIADAIVHLAKLIERDPDGMAYGTYHLAGSGEASWADLASEVMRVSAGLGGPSAEVRPIGTDQFPTRARRPANSRLDSTRFAEAFGWRAPDWRHSVAETVRRIGAKKA